MTGRARFGRVARARIDQRHLADDPARTDPLDGAVVVSEIDLAVDDREHHVARVALLEERLARLEIIAAGPF